MGNAARTQVVLDSSSEISRPDTPQILQEANARTQKASALAWFAVVVAGLGYFVDVFDMWLFSNFRVQSLTALGLTADQITTVGAKLINWQQFGFLVGGFCWGILGDKKGRASVMFASIVIYSLANLANSFVTTVPQYATLRFITGLGLAGEIGAGITLIAELLPKGQRGYGTTLVTALGVSGAIGAAIAGQYLDWRTAYIVGGVMGLLLLFLRFLVKESGMYKNMNKDSGLARGSLKLLFSSKERVARYLSCIFLGIPIYLCFGILATFSPEIAAAIGITEKITVPSIMLWASIGITVGDVGAGLLSQYMHSRRKPIALFSALGLLGSLYIAFGGPKTAFAYSVMLGFIGVFSGYWACLITTAAEQFGTNLRATVTTTVPNLIRASSILLTSSFVYFKVYFGIQSSILILVVVTYTLTLAALLYLRESFHQDLDFYEKH